jgi:hypothetical protein
MALNAQERAFVQRVQSNANKLADEIATAIELQAVYFDRGYDSGGANELVDADLADLFITATQLASYVTMAQQIENFRDNAAVTSADYGSTLSQVRAL